MVTQSHTPLGWILYLTRCWHISLGIVMDCQILVSLRLFLFYGFLLFVFGLLRVFVFPPSCIYYPLFNNIYWVGGIRCVRTEAHEESPTQKTSPIGGRSSWLKYHIKHFDLLDVALLTLSRPLRADVHVSFHFIGTDPMVALSFMEASITYQYSVEHLNPAYR